MKARISIRLVGFASLLRAKLLATNSMYSLVHSTIILIISSLKKNSHISNGLDKFFVAKEEPGSFTIFFCRVLAVVGCEANFLQRVTLSFPRNDNLLL